MTEKDTETMQREIRELSRSTIEKARTAQEVLAAWIESMERKDRK